MNKSLSVCIPTRNRATQLRETLEAFIPIVAPHEIPIYVSDNASTDGTAEMLQSFRRDRYPLLFARRSEANAGMDQNILDVVSMASSRYAWLFGDDDLPCRDAIERLLTILDSGYALIIANASTHSPDYRVLVEERRLKIYADRIYQAGDHDRLLGDTGAYTTFLGSLIVDLERWRSIDAQALIGSEYLHMGVVYRSVVGHPALVAAEPMIRIRLQKGVWFSRFFEIELVNLPRIIWGLPSKWYSDRAKRRVCQAHPKASLRRLMATRAYGHYDRGAYAAHVETDANIGAVRKAALQAVAVIPEGWLRTAFVGLIYTRRIFDPSRYELALFRLRQARESQGKRGLADSSRRSCPADGIVT